MIVCRQTDQIPWGWFLGDCAVSGGTLDSYLKEAMCFSGGKICIRLRPISVIFPLPCSTGVGIRPSQEKIRYLCSNHSAHFSDRLMTNYLTYKTNEGLFCLLFDTEDSLCRKMELLKALRIPMVLVEDQKLFHLLKNESAPQKAGRRNA